MFPIPAVPTAAALRRPPTRINAPPRIMSLPPRNAPCPCGSGRKYKHCCMPKVRTLALAAYSRRERADAFRKIEQFAMRDEFADDRRFADILFWAGRLDVAEESQRRTLESDDSAYAAFVNWFTFDLDLNVVNDDAHGTITDRFLASRGHTLTTGERTLVERMHASSLRLYEVRDVRLDEGLLLHDLWTGEALDVSERLGTHQIARWDLLGARVIEGETGRPVIDGTPYLYPLAAREAIMAEFKRHHARFTKEVGVDDPTGFFKRHGMVFHHLWLDHVVLRAMPTFVTHEGDPIAPTKTLFDVTDRERLADALAAHGAFEAHDDGTYAWLEGDGGSSRVLGHLSVAAGRLTLETMSEARAQRGRRLIEELLGDAVRFRMTRSEDVKQALADPPPRTRDPERLPADVEQQIVSQFYEQHYRAWIDEPVPALGGRTPRHAARLKTVRPKVVDLVKALENQMERERKEGRPAYDVTWMWAELGVDRP